MKKNIIGRWVAGFAVAIAIFASCTQEMSEVRLDPALGTTQSQTITSDSATVVGYVVAQGDGFTEKGICYATTPNPTIDNNKKEYTGAMNTATFAVRLGGLAYATKYYARAYAIGNNTVIYGPELTFTTKPVVPMLTTAAITDITGKTAKGGGAVTVAGGADVTERGIVWGTSQNPTVSNSKTSDGKGLGAFTSNITALRGNTKYYVRAYATNSAGVGYGPEVSFTTPIDLPEAVTTKIEEITKTSAKVLGEVTLDGGAAVTARGIVIGSSENPTLSDQVITSGNGVGSFTIELTGLAKNTKYHVRAYATNSLGTAYGENKSFTTLGDNLTWYVPGDYVAASYPGSTLANWSPDKSPMIKSTISDPDNLEGYVYMSAASNSFKITSEASWGGTNYGDGGAGKLSATGDNLSRGTGFYKIKVNAATLDYSMVALNWGVIGSAPTVGAEWNTETPLAYSAANHVWRGVVNFKVGEYKFRGGDWAYNYGLGDAAGTLKHDGANIPITEAGDYHIELDLSTPHAYTYKQYSWGLIGDAQGSWSTDKNMTWDATKKVFTITVDLVVGAVKFRANDDWAVNYGGALDALTPGGDNIAIGTAGNYTITFDPFGLKATVTKN